MNPWLQNTLILALIAGFACMEYVSRRYRDNVTASSNDTKLELLMFVSLVAITQPTALFGANALCSWLMPAQRNAFADLPWWAMVAAFLVADDMTQYWWHRLSHTPLLWPLHRAHHSASYMSIRITYRNNFFYYLMMPGLWMSGVLIYLGMGAVYVPYLVVKIAVILGSHCAWAWDEPLYRIKPLRPLMWLVQRTISTPATHWAHHALSNNDGIGHYEGNFGNLLFFWDVLFGSAHITQQYPPAVGLQDDRLFGDEHWAHQMFYPLAQSKREHSALRPGGTPYEEGPTIQAAGVEVAR